MPPPLLTLNLNNASNRDLAHHPVTFGVPLPAGRLAEPKGLAIALPDAKLRSLQAKPLEHWPDGSIKWLLLDFDLPLPRNATTAVGLVEGVARPGSRVVRVEETDRRITVTTPLLEVAFNRKAFSLFESYRVNGKQMVSPESDLIVEEPKGKRYYASNTKSLDVRVTERGTQRVVIEATGRHTAGDGTELLGFRVRYEFRPNEPGVKVSYKFTNAEPPETGVRLGSIQLHLATTLGRKSVHHLRQSNHGVNWFSRQVEIPENVEILASGAVNEAAKTRYGTTYEGAIVVRDLGVFRENTGEYPFYLRPGNARTDMTGGLRSAYPYIGVNAPTGSLVAFFLEMGSNFPKGLRADRGQVTFDLWPQWAGELLLRRGQSKEHDLYVSFADHGRDAKELEGIYFDHEITGNPPVHVTLGPDYVSSCEVLQLHRWLRYDEQKYLTIETKLGSAGNQGKTDFAASNKGMMDYGDYINPDRSWAHNNEDDAILNQTREFFRCGAPGLMRSALAKARHNAHVDFIAFDPDPLRQGTMPAHCPEHTDGATYPSHMWVDGLLAAYCVSGNPDFRDAAMAVGENMLRWQQERPVIFYADSRECGWPALAYLRLFEHTGEQRWLDAVQAVFEHMRGKVNDDGVILYELPHGVGTQVGGYGEFIAWRALYFYYELTQRQEVKDFLVRTLPKVCKFRPGHMVMGWACNDMFPAWAIYKLTGERKYLADNYPFLRFLMARNENFPWGGNDMHFYLGELDRLGELQQFTPPVGQ